MKNVTIDELALSANTIRGLAIDGVQSANSGHPGLPMGMADVAAVLFLGFLKHSPQDVDWADRDRFVLSGGHGSMLLYSLLHLSGYDLPIEELANFRQLGSLTPGHPEVRHTPGVETTTGPLGQGCGNAVGMALAERMLAERFNTEEFQHVDHYTYVMCGDGDMMEGLSHETFSLAGHLGLNKLVLFYDSNRITIEGSTELAYSDDVKMRFKSYNWNVIEIDAHDYVQIEKAIRKSQREKNRPTIIVCNSHIGQGSPNKVDTASAHGEPLGVDEIKATKRNLGLPENEDFYIPDSVRELFAAREKSMKRQASKWARSFKKYCAAYPEQAALLQDCIEDRMPENLEDFLPEFELDKAIATRSASGKVIQYLAEKLPQFVGGAADLAPSTKTFIDGAGSIAVNAFGGKNLHYGVREHAMGALMNGVALHGGFRIFGATFFVFSDYCRPAIRLAAIMELPVVYVFTHDSFYVGEDGPTHQPVEQAVALRSIPNVTVIRPSDATETGFAWLAALENKTGPTALLLTRQNLNVIDRSKYAPASGLRQGAYTLWQNGDGMPDVILLASGSEVDLVLSAAKELAGDYNVRVVSMPSWELFEKQSDSYRESVLPSACKMRVVAEAGSGLGWQRYVGDDGGMICMTGFGCSGPYQKLVEKYGFTVEHVVAVVRQKMLG